MANSIYDYLGDEELWNRSVRAKDDPKRRTTPGRLASPFGTVLVESSARAKITRAYKAGTIFRFRYTSVNRPGYIEHDKNPWVILLNGKDGNVFYTSNSERHSGDKLFHGINLNYLENEAVVIMLEAIKFQNVTKGPPSYDLLKAFDTFIPEIAYRTYYVKGVGSPKLIKVSRKNG